MRCDAMRCDADADADADADVVDLFCCCAAKNVILAGVKSVGILDNHKVEIGDLSAQVMHTTRCAHVHVCHSNVMTHALEMMRHMQPDVS